MGRVHRWGMIFAFLVIIGCAYIGIKMVFIEDKDSEVPSVVGMQLIDAVDALQERGLLAKVDKVDSPITADTVVSQNLFAGEKVSKGKVILLRVSKGGAMQPIPDVRGLKFEEGVRKLSETGFKVDKITRVTDKLKPSGTIIAQNPASPQQVAANCMVSLLVSSGAGGERSFVLVPDLRGQNQEAAIAMIEQLGLSLGQTADAPSASMATGSVLSSRPKGGAKVPVGSLINLTFAREPLASERTNDIPPPNDQDKERAEAVRKVVIKETAPTAIPSKLPTAEEPAVKRAEPVKTEPANDEAPKLKTPAPAPKPAPAEPAAPAKSAKVRYQVPPLTKPLSLKIEMTDDTGMRVLKDSMANSGEYISMNVPYAGEARITIFLGGDFVWQDRYN